MSYIRQIAIALSVAGLVAGGWFTRGWFEDSRALAAAEAQARLAESVRSDISEISEQVDKRLSQLRANERIIDRGVIREIQKPIYQRVCIEPDLVGVLNAALRGESVAGSAESPDQVPESAGAAD